MKIFCTYMHITTLSKKGGHEFEEQGGIYRSVWREERERGNDVPKISEKQKKKIST